MTNSDDIEPSPHNRQAPDGSMYYDERAAMREERRRDRRLISRRARKRAAEKAAAKPVDVQVPDTGFKAWAYNIRGYEWLVIGLIALSMVFVIIALITASRASPVVMAVLSITAASLTVMTMLQARDLRRLRQELRNAYRNRMPEVGYGIPIAAVALIEDNFGGVYELTKDGLEKIEPAPAPRGYEETELEGLGKDEPY